MYDNSFADKETEKVYELIFSKKLSHDIKKKMLRKLAIQDNAGCLKDLLILPSNHLEALDDHKGQYSIRINKHFRICFFIKGLNDFCDVEIVDYH